MVDNPAVKAIVDVSNDLPAVLRIVDSEVSLVLSLAIDISEERDDISAEGHDDEAPEDSDEE